MKERADQMGQGTHGTVTAMPVSGAQPKTQSERGKKPNPERLLSLPQAAHYLGISETTIRRAQTDGKRRSGSQATC
jgi:hypothetical protein